MEKIDKNLVSSDVESTQEKNHRIIRSALSTIPILGGVAIEAFSALIEPPISKRRELWMIQVTDAVNNLITSNILKLDDLQKNEIFFTTLIHASQIAVANHQEEKIKFLKSALINTAINPILDDSLHQYLIGLIDYLTVYHVKVLKLFHAPCKVAGEHGKEINHLATDSCYTRSTILLIVYPELRGSDYFSNQIWHDLINKGLLRPDRPLNKNQQGESILFGCTTPLGEMFLSLISEGM
ncbi:hypothetical protein WB896_004518 [Vibrio vulnificus]